MLIKVQTFAICHDQDLIIANNQHYQQLENLTWLLVGVNKATDKLVNSGIKFIHCETFTNNIENKPQLLHGTALHLLANNDSLIDADTKYIRFIEYDMEFHRNYTYNCQRSLQFGKQIYGHMEVPLKHCWNTPKYLNHLNDICLREKFKTSLENVTKKCRSGKWICSINLVFSVEFFKNFYNFYQNFIPYYLDRWKESGDLVRNQGPNNLERLFTIYCLQHNIQWGIIPGASHKFSNSHKLS